MVGRDLPLWLFHRWPIRAPAIVLTAATLSGFLILRERSTGSGAAPNFPPDLQQRAPLLTAAWLDGDLVSMLAMTDPARDRELRRWYTQTLVPQPPPHDDASGIDVRSLRTIDLVSVKHRDGQASVVVRIGSQLEGDAARAVVVEQQWVERRGIWYFAPRTLARGNRRIPPN